MSGFSPSSYVIGASAGATAAIAAGAAMREEEAARGRRLSHQGNDQLLLRVRGSVKAVGEAIATLYPNWYWDDENEVVMSHDAREFNGIWAFVAGLGTLIALLIGIFFFPYHEIPYNPLTGLLIIIAIAAIAGIIPLIYPGVSEVESIRIRAHDGGATVLLKKYDDSGSRQLDEDEILYLIETFRKARLEGGAE